MSDNKEHASPLLTREDLLRTEDMRLALEGAKPLDVNMQETIQLAHFFYDFIANGRVP